MVMHIGWGAVGVWKQSKEEDKKRRQSTDNKQDGEEKSQHTNRSIHFDFLKGGNTLCFCFCFKAAGVGPWRGLLRLARLRGQSVYFKFGEPKRRFARPRNKRWH